MECPVCGQKVLTFWQWARGWKAFRAMCPHCGEPLRANRRTLLWMVAAPVTVLVAAVAALGIQEETGWGEGALRAALAALGFVVVVVFSLAAWKTGGYVSRRK